jgi:hypothetical protein
MLFPSGLQIGIVGTSGFSIQLRTASGVFSYLPQVGPPGALNADLIDSSSSSSGAFGGDIAALALNVAASDAHLFSMSTSIAFGNLYICNLSPVVDGQTVRQFLATANILLGGGTVSGLSPDTADSLTMFLNAAFAGGMPSTFAQEHLFVGVCP